MSHRWKSFEFFHSGDTFLKKIIELIHSAKHSIDLESYIFMPDKMGMPVLEALSKRERDGIRVRILVDGIGSGGHLLKLRSLAEQHHLDIKVFNPLPAISLFGLIQTDLSNRQEMAHMLQSGFSTTMAKLNKRNHRKALIIDDRIAMIGGMNISDVTCSSVWGSKAWRDTSVLIESSEIEELCHAFRHAWHQASFLMRNSHKNLSAKEPRHPSQPKEDGQIYLNDRAELRKAYHREFFRRIAQAQERIYFVTPYFVPTRRLLKSLAAARARGVDIQIILPQRSDVRFLDFLKDPYISYLHGHGVRIFEYRTAVLHAKYAIIDGLGSVGSGNLNHRSLLHDLEVEATFSQQNGLEEIEKQWFIDLSRCHPISPLQSQTRSIIQKLMAQIIFWFRYYL